MPTPAQAHAQRVAAARRAADAATGSGAPSPNATAYELMLVKLAEDRRRLKAIESQARKIELKRQLLPDYTAWVEGALQGKGGQDDVLMTVLVWRMDTGDWPGALDIAAYALRHGLTLPDQYRRNLPCLLAEEVADNALRGEPVPAAVLAEFDALLADCDMPDQVRAKLAKAWGYALIAEAREATPGDDMQAKVTALAQLQRAMRLNDKAGVKRDIELLARDIKNTAGADPA